MSKIGVFICHCGENIARTVQVKRVMDFARQIAGTVVIEDYPYVCSAPGQKIVMEAIKKHGIDGVVVNHLRLIREMHQLIFNSHGRA